MPVSTLQAAVPVFNTNKKRGPGARVSGRRTAHRASVQQVHAGAKSQTGARARANLRYLVLLYQILICSGVQRRKTDVQQEEKTEQEKEEQQRPQP